jgi:hypothetical protein
MICSPWPAGQHPDGICSSQHKSGWLIFKPVEDSSISCDSRQVVALWVAMLALYYHHPSGHTCMQGRPGPGRLTLSAHHASSHSKRYLLCRPNSSLVESLMTRLPVGQALYPCCCCCFCHIVLYRHTWLLLTRGQSKLLQIYATADRLDVLPLCHTCVTNSNLSTACF